MKKKWIVVAESCRARIFSVESRNSPLKEIDAMEYDPSLNGEVAIAADYRAEGHQGGRASMDPRMEPKEVEALHFAQDLGERLETARRGGDYNDLVLISPPGFLGMLKQHLGNVTHKYVSKTINKNLIDKKESEIRSYVFN